MWDGWPPKSVHQKPSNNATCCQNIGVCRNRTMPSAIECDRSSTIESKRASRCAGDASSSAHDSAHIAKKHMRGSSLLLVGRGLATLINFAVQVLVVRYLSVAEFGAFAFG